MSMMIAVLARQQAIKITKRQLQAQGLKVWHIAAKEITRQAEAYLDQHRAELFEEVRRWIASSPHLQKLYDQEQRRIQRQLQKIGRAELSTAAQKEKH